MLESEQSLWREKLSTPLPETKDRDDDLNGPVLVSEMGFLRDAGVPQIRLSEVSARLEAAPRTVKAVKTALRRESDLGPKALRGVTTAWSQVIVTPSDAALAREHFRKLAMASAMAQSMRDRARGTRR
jgi:hypothetical protein